MSHTLIYPAFAEQDAPDDWAIVFPDVPEAVTGGTSEEAAWANAPEALAVALGSYPERKLDFPKAHRTGKNQRAIAVSAVHSAKLFLRHQLMKQNFTAADLARILDLDHKGVRRILNLHHRTRMDELERALNALGLTVTLIAA